MRLLVVEDDITIATPLCSGLEREGFEVELARTGREALAASGVDLVLLDLGLPDLDGRAVCREIREHSAVPIIVVTARADEVDRLMLFELGVDDYVIKPFGFRELVARIRAVLRRSSAETATPTGIDDEVIRVADLTIDLPSRRVEYAGVPSSLTPREFDLLVYLARSPGIVHTRDQIMADVWDENWWGSTKTLDVHVASLRKKTDPDLIETLRGVGFMVVGERPTT